MSSLPTFIADLALILISASVITLLFKWMKQPLVLGYIVAGLLAGPYIRVFPTVADKVSIHIWSEIGVIFLLFALGLEFSFKKLVNVGSTALIAASTEVVTMLLIGYGVGRLLGWDTMDSVFLGGMLSMSSTTIIIKAFDDLGLRKERFTGIVFGTLVVEDLIAILMMVILSTLAASQDSVGEELVMGLLKVAFFLILWFLIGIFLLPAFLKKAKRLMNNETLLIVSLGLCLGMVILATRTGFSSALGAFIMGSILAETVEAEPIERLIQPVKDLFGAIFFVSVGMLVNPLTLVKYAVPILVITVVTIVGKGIFSSCGVLLSGAPLKTSIRSGFSLAQIGEFAFIIAGLGASLKILDSFIAPIIVAVSVITTFTTPYFIRLSVPFSNWLYQALPPRIRGAIDRYASGKKTVNHDRDWRNLLKSVVGRMIIYSVLLTAIILLSIEIVYPIVVETFPPVTIWLNLGMCVVTFLLMAPFLWALVSNRYNAPHLFSKMWNDDTYNHGRLLALVLLRVVVALFFITAVIVYYLRFNYGIGIVLSLVVLVFLLLFGRKLTQYPKLEEHFFLNLNRREAAEKERYPLKASFHSEFNDKDIQLESVDVSPCSSYIGKTLGELAIRKEFGVNVVEIIRGELRLYLPATSERIYPQDSLVVVGTDRQIRSFRDKMEGEESKECLRQSPKDVALHSFTITGEFPFLDESIAESRLGKMYDLLIVAIERKGELITPDGNTIFRLGDLVWVVGERKKIREFF